MLSDDTDPMVTVMKLEKAPQETYADIGGLDQQIQVNFQNLNSDISVKFAETYFDLVWLRKNMVS